MPSADAAPPPVLLLHGLATTAERTWRDNGWIDLLADTGRTVLAPDLLGHGSAPKPHEPAAYADIGSAVVAGLPGGPVDAVGFSLGARVLLARAAEDPGRFRRLVVAGVGANLFRRQDRDVIVRALEGDADPGDPVARYFAGLAAQPGMDGRALAALLQATEEPLTREAVASVTCPVLVVIGDRDFAGPPDPLVDALPDSRLVVLRGTDHFATPKDLRFIDATLDFLGAVRLTG